MVKGLVGPEGWQQIVEKYIPRAVYNQFLIKFNGLQKRWFSLLHRAGVTENQDKGYNELIHFYAEKQRAYHNLVHLAHTLREFDAVVDSIKNPEQLEFALYYHDAVYNPHANDNEEKSSELAERQLTKARLSPEVIRNVKELILATKHKESSRGSAAIHYIADIDLAIFGKAEEEFDEYEKAIKREYSLVPEEQFKQGRTAVLKSFLSRSSIYRTQHFEERYETQARKNLERSLLKLRKNKDMHHHD